MHHGSSSNVPADDMRKVIASQIPEWCRCDVCIFDDMSQCTRGRMCAQSGGRSDVIR